jgi:hypothetical protein
MNVNITSVRRVIYNQLCSVCGQGFLIREDFIAHVRDPNRKIGGSSSRFRRFDPIPEPQKPEALGPPDPLTQVWCGNNKCGLRFHHSAIQEYSVITEDSAQVEYEQKLKDWRDECNQNEKKPWIKGGPDDAVD